MGFGMRVVEPVRVVAAERLLDALPDAVVVIDSGGTVLEGNRTAARLMGRPVDEWRGQSGLDLIHPDDAHLAALSLASVQGKEVGTAIELRVRGKDGWRLMEIVGAPMDDGLIVLSMRDLTERRRWEVAGDDIAGFRSLVQNSTTLTALLNGDGIVRSVSSAVTRLLGHDPEDVCSASLLRIVDPTDRLGVESALAAARTQPSGSEPVVVEAGFTHFSGAIMPFELTVVSLLDDPTVRGLVVSAHDITRLRQAREAAAALAHLDALTGLPNRRAFDAALARAWTTANGDGIESLVFVLDLDGFKHLNDCFGHSVGDEALRHVADALRSSVRETDFVARLGGDEFGVILVGCAADAGRQFEQTLRQRLEQHLDALPAAVGFTIGHESLHSAGDAATVLHQADMAMLARKPNHS